MTDVQLASIGLRWPGLELDLPGRRAAGGALEKGHRQGGQCIRAGEAHVDGANPGQTWSAGRTGVAERTAR